MTYLDYVTEKYPEIDINEFEKMETELKSLAVTIFEKVSAKHKPNTGIYYPATELYLRGCGEWAPFVIAELKQLGVEFIENNTLYRI